MPPLSSQVGRSGLGRADSRPASVPEVGDLQIVYFSSASLNTHRFVEKVGLPARRIPLRATDPELLVEVPYVLITPTYGGGAPERAVPKPVIRFLNNPGNRALIRGVIASGNLNFGQAYAIAGDIIARKCQVPYLYRFELMGTADDVERVRDGLTTWWKDTIQL